jgi:hypothetical protein
MKRIILLFLLVQTINCKSQTVSYGPFVGTQGANSSYFGYFTASLATSASTDNSFFGYQSGFMTLGTQNVGLGGRTLYNNSSGSANTATGFEALLSNTTGSYNTANGFSSLRSNTSGTHNTAGGFYALGQNTIGTNNTATGNSSLYSNKNGNGNTANGTKALYLNTAGDNNTATGTTALYSNGTGGKNTANGFEALYSNADGSSNTAAGARALYANISGRQNTATGYEAAYSNSRGKNNTANGYNALYYNATGDDNSGFGANAGPNSGNLFNTTALGYFAMTLASNQVRIGNTSVTSIGGYALWTSLSDRRFKKNIREDVSGLDFVNQLRPVSYEIDKLALNRFLNIPDSMSQHLNAQKAPARETGFIAQEVESIIKKTGFSFSGVEAPQNEQDHYSIRYAAFVVPLVKAVQELSAKLDEQERKFEEQQLEMVELRQKLGISNVDASDLKVALLQNNPNPFSADTEIKMILPESVRHANLILYNMEGKQLKNIDMNDRGNVSVKISANDLGAGIYLYALIVDGKMVDTKRLVLTK